jgi:hypothetical protein
VDVSEEGKEDGDENGLEALPSLRYMSTRRYNPMSSISRPGFGHGGSDQLPDVYHTLDKSLEIVQSTCEHGAHQFLRDGDCNDKISEAQNQLSKVLEMATKEMNRVQREEPELAKEAGELEKAQKRRPIPPSPDAPIEVDPKFIEAESDKGSTSRWSSLTAVFLASDWAES